MDYIISSTLSTLTGLCVIALWVLIGYLSTYVWLDFKKPELSIKVTIGLACGLLTFIGLILHVASLRLDEK